MSKDNVIRFCSPEAGAEDALTEVPRQGSRQLLLQAVQAELEEFLSRYSQLRDADGRRQVVRNGYLPEREVQRGIGTVQVTRHFAPVHFPAALRACIAGRT